MSAPENESATANESAPGRSKPTGIRRFVGGFWFNLIAAFLVLALVQAFFVKLYTIPSGSMESTLKVSDRILVNRVEYALTDPKPGDVVVFTASDAWDRETSTPSNPISWALRWVGGLIGIGPSLEHTLVKRIVAGPGQVVKCCDPVGSVVVDGASLTEPYIYENLPFVAGTLDCVTVPASARCFTEYTVPPGDVFVLGDHRSNSNDSIAGCRGSPTTASCVKLVKRGDIVGRAFAVVLPPGHWRGL